MSFNVGGRFRDSIALRYSSYWQFALTKLPWIGSRSPTGISRLWKQHCSKWSLVKCSCRWLAGSRAIVQIGLDGNRCLSCGGVGLEGCCGCGAYDAVECFEGRVLGGSVWVEVDLVRGGVV
jgi:hypothetical protein